MPLAGEHIYAGISTFTALVKLKLKGSINSE